MAVEKELGMQKDEQEKPEPELSDEVKILTEIRDLIKDNTMIVKGD